MGESDILGEAVERLEWDELGEDDCAPKKLRQLTRRTALSGGAAGLATLVLEACGGGASSKSASASATGAGAAAGIFGSSPSYSFTFINHLTTSPVFTPTMNGASDACKLLNCSYQWTGSQTGNVFEMVDALGSAISAGVNGIAVSLIDRTAFNSPVRRALSAGIPTIAYNADAPGNARLAYIGQDLFVSGQQMGTRIASLLPAGDVALFIATPGALNVQPRIDGALSTLGSHPGITARVLASGPTVSQELTTIDNYAVGHPETRGLFAVDGGSTQSVAQVIQKHGLVAKGVKGGGYDLTPVTEQLLAAGQIEFAIDQQPYLQGFLPVLEMYLYNVTQKLIGIADVDTGLKFLDKTSVAAYNTTKSRYEGTATGVGVQKA
jgi:simple sugar transport system substrate-binding protein